MKTLGACLLLIFASLLPATTIAQTIPKLAVTEMPVGFLAVYARPDGTRFATKYVGVEGGLHVVESREGEAGDGSLISRATYDDAGMRRSWENNQNGWDFEPHACYRVAGSCDYKANNRGNGRAYRNTIDADIGATGAVTWRRYHKGQIRATGEYMPDGPYGVPTAWSHYPTGGKETSARLVETVTP